jgi:multisite-specific tRNA:(cytosine-C5)-methyltransferase/tRNA (cytosine34-C5)-methyltransferase
VREVDGNAKKNVLLVSRGVKRFLEADREKRIKLVNMGCKVLEKGKESFAGHECLYRLSQEGIHFILPFMTERKVLVTLEFFRAVLAIHSVVHEDIKEQ